MAAAVVCGCDTDEIKDILKIRLSQKRYTHSLNVAQSARKLAEKYADDYKDCDLKKAYLAGLVHDICKEAPKDEQLRMARECGMDFSDTEALIPPLYHAPAGVYYCRSVLGIHDEEVLRAVRYHTIGNADMSPVEKIVFLADLISEDRSYKDVGRMRKLSFIDMDVAVLEALKFSVADIMAKGSLIPEATMKAYNYYASLKK